MPRSHNLTPLEKNILHALRGAALYAAPLGSQDYENALETAERVFFDNLHLGALTAERKAMAWITIDRVLAPALRVAVDSYSRQGVDVPENAAANLRSYVAKRLRYA